MPDIDLVKIVKANCDLVNESNEASLQTIGNIGISLNKKIKPQKVFCLYNH